MRNYHFRNVEHCEMCKENTTEHKTLGQRLDKSQGFSPKKNSGISVSVNKCNNCGLIYSQPQPIPHDIQDHYGTPPEDYWQESYFKWDKSYFQTQITQVLKLLPSKEQRKALDIGAGLGKAMISLDKAGFEAYGLEPSEPFYQRAIEKMGISKDRMKLGMMENLDYAENSFDFVTFGAVFEHIYSPSECLKQALGWTKKGGIVHIEVPSADWFLPKIINLYYRLRGTNYVTNLSPMHSPFHLHEFTLTAFKELAAKLNCTVEKYQYDVCSIYFAPKFLHPLLRAYMKRTNKGMQLTVYLRKL